MVRMRLSWGWGWLGRGGSLRLGFFLGFVMPDGAAGSSADDTVMAGRMPRYAAYRRAGHATSLGRNRRYQASNYQTVQSRQAK